MPGRVGAGDSHLRYRETEATSQLSAILTTSCLATLWVTRRCAVLEARAPAARAWCPFRCRLGCIAAPVHSHISLPGSCSPELCPQPVTNAFSCSLLCKKDILPTTMWCSRLGLALGELDKLTDGKAHITESQKLGKFE